MRIERKKQLAKVAYMYYVEEKTQSEIASETGIYRTTVCRMLQKAKAEGIVKIEIQSFDTRLYALESYVKKKYGLKSLEVVPKIVDEEPVQSEKRLAQAAADVFVSLIKDDMVVGMSWGRSLSQLVEAVGIHRVNNIVFLPLAGGPSHINAKYHVNTLIYSLANKFHGECTFVNATIMQENEHLTKGIISSKYFENLKNSWKQLDLAVVGIGGQIKQDNIQWLDMLTEEDFAQLSKDKAVGEICCRFFDNEGQLVGSELQNRVISIPLEELKRVPNVLSLAYGDAKVHAILSALRKGYINHLVTDEETILKVLELDNDHYQ